jgi:hypothetical protein
MRENSLQAVVLLESDFLTNFASKVIQKSSNLPRVTRVTVKHLQLRSRQPRKC